jgi:hypothetical protein
VPDAIGIDEQSDDENNQPNGRKHEGNRFENRGRRAIYPDKYFFPAWGVRIVAAHRILLARVESVLVFAESLRARALVSDGGVTTGT